MSSGVIVTTFIIQNETTNVFNHVFDVILKWYPDFDPQVIVTDKCDALITSIKLKFPNAKHILCYFHAKAAVEKWTTKHLNPGDKETLKRYFELLHFAGSKQRFNYIKNQLLKRSNLWKNHESVQRYFQTEWFPFAPLWSRYGYSHVFHLNSETNNVVEALNRVVKQMTEKIVCNKNLTSLIESLITVTLPANNRKSAQKAAKILRRQNANPQNLGPFFQNRDKQTARSMVNRHRNSSKYIDSISPIADLRDGLFHVTHPNDDDAVYDVDFLGGKCSCKDFTANLGGYAPCKHLYAVSRKYPDQFSLNKLLQDLRRNQRNDINTLFQSNSINVNAPIINTNSNQNNLLTETNLKTSHLPKKRENTKFFQFKKVKSKMIQKLKQLQSLTHFHSSKSLSQNLNQTQITELEANLDTLDLVYENMFELFKQTSGDDFVSLFHDELHGIHKQNTFTPSSNIPQPIKRGRKRKRKHSQKSRKNNAKRKLRTLSINLNKEKE